MLLGVDDEIVGAGNEVDGYAHLLIEAAVAPW